MLSDMCADSFPSLPMLVPASYLQAPESPAMQPFPQFYIIRPDRRAVPLVALDELPSWIQVGNWDWNDLSLFHAMLPVALSHIPRVGEYDVICHHCCSSLDIIHRSVSERSDKNSPNGSSGPLPGVGSRSFPGATSSMSKVLPAQLLSSSCLRFGSFGSLKQPPFSSSLHSPFVGMCLMDFENPFGTSSLSLPKAPLTPPGDTRSEEGSRAQRPTLNPEAAMFSPVSPTASQRYNGHGLPSPPRWSDDEQVPPRPIPSTVGTENLLGFSLPISNDKSSMRSRTHAAVEQLKQAIGIKDREAPEGGDRDLVDTEILEAEVLELGLLDAGLLNPELLDAELQEAELLNTLEKDLRTRQAQRNRARKGTLRTRRIRRGPRRKVIHRRGVLGGDVSYRKEGPEKQENSSTRRQVRRERINRDRKDVSPGSRYWHMMMIPNWRGGQVPQR